MILIKSVEIIEVDRNEIRLAMFPDGHLDPRKPLVRDLRLTDEMVIGRRFVTADGREIVIGMTKEVQKAIGLPYEAFDNLQKEFEGQISILRSTVQGYKEYKYRIENMSFCKRFKALFVGFR